MIPTVDWLTHGTMDSGTRLIAVPVRRVEVGSKCKEVKYVVKNNRYYIRYKIERTKLLTSANMGGDRNSRTMAQASFNEEPVTINLHNWFDNLFNPVETVGPRVIGVYRPGFLSSTYGSSREDIFSMHSGDRWYRVYNNTRRAYDVLSTVRRRVEWRLKRTLNEVVAKSFDETMVETMKSIIGVPDAKNDNWSTGEHAVATVMHHMDTWTWSDGIDFRKAFNKGLLKPADFTIEADFDTKYAGFCGWRCSWKFLEVGGYDDFMAGKFVNMKKEPDATPEEVFSRLSAGTEDEAAHPLVINGQPQVQLLAVVTTSRNKGAYEGDLTEEEKKWKKFWK